MGKKLTLPFKTRADELDELRHPAIRALKGKKIGPLFPIDENHQRGQRGVPLPKTKSSDKKRWEKYRAKRTARRKIAHASRVRNKGR